MKISLIADRFHSRPGSAVHLYLYAPDLRLHLCSVASKFRGSETGPSIVMVTGTPATELRLRGSGGGPTAGASYDVKVGDVISVV